MLIKASLFCVTLVVVGCQSSYAMRYGQGYDLPNASWQLEQNVRVVVESKEGIARPKSATLAKNNPGENINDEKQKPTWKPRISDPEEVGGVAGTSTVRPQRDLRVSNNTNIRITDSAFWRQEWYLGENGMNVTGAWEQCATGKGIVIAVVDDGVNRHRELANSLTDPYPSYGRHHGTQVAGIIANSLDGNCGVGVAYDSKIQVHSLRFGSEIEDHEEAAALRRDRQRVHIYSNSWGPPESNVLLGRVGPDTKDALSDGIIGGRGGKGSVFVWAAGNGGLNGNSCAYDGYINSRYTIAVTGVTRHGRRLRSGESCSAILAATYSQHSNDRDIITSEGSSGCSDTFSDSSAATPFAAGAVALMLEKNKGLTWRDIQHIIMKTAKSEGLWDGRWDSNAAGVRWSPVFGFGLLNVGEMVEVARTWSTVPGTYTCRVWSDGPSEIRRYSGLQVPVHLGRDCVIDKLEHVEVHLNLEYTYRGHIKVDLRHGGVISTVLPGRYQDAFEKSLDWTVLSLQFWGEDPNTSAWSLHFSNAFADRHHDSNGNLRDWTVTFYGTRNGDWHQQPQYHGLQESAGRERCTIQRPGGYQPGYQPSRPDHTNRRPGGRHSNSGCSSRFSYIRSQVLLDIGRGQYRTRHGVGSLQQCQGLCVDSEYLCRSVTYFRSSGKCTLNAVGSRDVGQLSTGEDVVLYDRVCGGSRGGSRSSRPGQAHANNYPSYSNSYPSGGYPAGPWGSARRPSNTNSPGRHRNGGDDCSQRFILVANNQVLDVRPSQYEILRGVSSSEDCKQFCLRRGRFCRSVTYFHYSRRCSLNRVGASEAYRRRTNQASSIYDRDCRQAPSRTW